MNTTCDTEECQNSNITKGVDFLIRGRCEQGQYNDLASLLLSSSTDAVKALFLRGAPRAKDGLNPSASGSFLLAASQPRQHLC